MVITKHCPRYQKLRRWHHLPFPCTSCAAFDCPFIFSHLADEDDSLASQLRLTLCGRQVRVDVEGFA